MIPSKNSFEVIIIGGSYAGLSAARALGRSLRKVRIIDGGNPCNKQTPHSHNFLTQDGQAPVKMARLAKAQVLKYKTLKFIQGVAARGTKSQHGFEISTQSGEAFNAKKVLFATGVKDLFPHIKGFSECWGISVLHCPYCHGYEVSERQMGIVGNGDLGYELCKLLINWSKNLILFTNGVSMLTTEQETKIRQHEVEVVEKQIVEFIHDGGHIKQLLFSDGSYREISAIFTRVPFKQHSDIPGQLGCVMREQGLIDVDDFGKTSVPGFFCAGDNSTMFRAVSLAVASGTKAGAFINKELIDENF